jgi:ABC-2 type transport system permease protein
LEARLSRDGNQKAIGRVGRRHRHSDGAAMPRVLQWFTFINPLRYFLVIIRAQFLKGVGVRVLLPELSALALLGLVTLTFTVLRFRKSLD